MPEYLYLSWRPPTVFAKEMYNFILYDFLVEENKLVSMSSCNLCLAQSTLFGEHWMQTFLDKNQISDGGLSGSFIVNLLSHVHRIE